MFLDLSIRPNWRRSFGLVTFDPDPWEMTSAANRIQEECHEGHVVRHGPPEIEFFGLNPSSDSDSDESVVGNGLIVLDEWSLDPGFY